MRTPPGGTDQLKCPHMVLCSLGVISIQFTLQHQDEGSCSPPMCKMDPKDQVKQEAVGSQETARQWETNTSTFPLISILHELPSQGCQIRGPHLKPDIRSEPWAALGKWGAEGTRRLWRQTPLQG